MLLTRGTLLTDICLVLIDETSLFQQLFETTGAGFFGSNSISILITTFEQESKIARTLIKAFITELISHGCRLFYKCGHQMREKLIIFTKPIIF